MHFETRRQAQDEVIDWLAFYNRKRMHSTLGYTSPDGVRGKLASPAKSAWRHNQALWEALHGGKVHFFFPGMDLAGIEAVLTGQLANRAVALDGRQGDFRLERALFSARLLTAAPVSAPHIGAGTLQTHLSHFRGQYTRSARRVRRVPVPPSPPVPPALRRRRHRRHGNIPRGRRSLGGVEGGAHLLRIRWLLAMTADVAHRPPPRHPHSPQSSIPVSTGRHPSCNKL